MQSWNLSELEAHPHQPEILSSSDEGRSILLLLPAGEQLQEHEVHERAWLLVVDGEIEVGLPDQEVPTAGGAGHLFELDPGERHEVTARADARLLLLLSPWPGDGHPGALTLTEKAAVRDRARDR